MSFNVNAIAASQQAAAIAAAAASSGASPAMVSAVVMSDEPVTVDTIPAVPPSEVLDAVRAASATYDTLAGAGHHVHFTTDPHTGRVVIQVLNRAGNAVGTLSPGAALHAAAGGELQMTSPATTSSAAGGRLA